VYFADCRISEAIRDIVADGPQSVTNIVFDLRPTFGVQDWRRVFHEAKAMGLVVTKDSPSPFAVVSLPS
jgi:hypothetical protein